MDFSLHGPLGQSAAWAIALSKKGFAYKFSDVELPGGGTEERLTFYKSKLTKVQCIEISLSGPNAVTTATPLVLAYTTDKRGNHQGDVAEARGQDLTEKMKRALAYVGSPVKEADQKMFASVGRLMGKAWGRATSAFKATKATPQVVFRKVLEGWDGREEKKARLRFQKQGWETSERVDLKLPGATTFVRRKNGIEQVVHLHKHDPVGPDGSKFTASLSTAYHRGAGDLSSEVSLGGRSALSKLLRVTNREARIDLTSVNAANAYKHKLVSDLAHKVSNPSDLKLTVVPTHDGSGNLSIAICEGKTVLRTVEALPGRQFDFVQQLLKEQFAMREFLPVTGMPLNEISEIEAKKYPARAAEPKPGKEAGRGAADSADFSRAAPAFASMADLSASVKPRKSKDFGIG